MFYPLYLAHVDTETGTLWLDKQAALKLGGIYWPSSSLLSLCDCTQLSESTHTLPLSKKQTSWVMWVRQTRPHTIFLRDLSKNLESHLWIFHDFPLFFQPHLAISFLIETGNLLHFPDTSHGLCTLYFLCPVWLSECLERIMHLKSSQSVARNGVIRVEDLRVSWHFREKRRVLWPLLIVILTSSGDVSDDICCTDAIGGNRVHQAYRGAVFPVSCQVWDCSPCGQQQVKYCIYTSWY